MKELDWEGRGPRFCPACGRRLQEREFVGWVFLSCPKRIGWRLWFTDDWRDHYSEAQRKLEPRYDPQTGARNR